MGILDDVFDEILPEVIDALSDSAITLTQETGTYDPMTGLASSQSSLSVKATPFDSYTQDEINNTQIQRSDLRTIVAAEDLGAFVIAPNKTKLARGGKSYTIVSVKPIFGGDRAVAYELQCRGVS